MTFIWPLFWWTTLHRNITPEPTIGKFFPPLLLPAEYTKVIQTVILGTVIWKRGCSNVVVHLIASLACVPAAPSLQSCDNPKCLLTYLKSFWEKNQTNQGAAYSIPNIQKKIYSTAKWITSSPTLCTFHYLLIRLKLWLPLTRVLCRKHTAQYVSGQISSSNHFWTFPKSFCWCNWLLALGFSLRPNEIHFLHLSNGI